MEILTLKQLLSKELPSIPSVIGDGILYSGTRMLVYGRYKSYKSMLAIHTSMSIASGRPWFGHQVARRSVLHCQVEIPEFLFQNRMTKYCAGNNCYPENIYFSNEPYMKLDRGNSMNHLEIAIQAFKPDVLVIDPLYKVMTGKVEESQDITKFTDEVDRIKDKYHLTLIIIHHETKDIITSQGIFDRGSQSMHGSAYLLNWADTIIKVEADTLLSRVRLQFTDMRHAEDIVPDVYAVMNKDTLEWKQIEGGMDIHGLL